MSTTSEGRKLRIAVLGCGFMGTALVSGMLNATECTQDDLKFFLTARSEASIERLREHFSSKTAKVTSKTSVITTDNVVAARNAEVIILAFQPQQLKQILGDPPLKDALREKLIISLLAGVSIKDIIDTLGVFHSGRLSRVIPSIGAQINESATLVAVNEKLSTANQELVVWLFQQVGKTQMVPEQLISTVTAVSAATHALVVVATDAIVDGSVAQGVPRSMALAVASQCLRGASTLLQGQMTIESLKESMSIERGITINALLELERGQVRSGISDAVRHAVTYAEGM